MTTAIIGSGITVPEHYGDTSKPHNKFQENILYFLRECGANAVTYNATKAHCYAFEHNSEHWVVVATDAVPFDSMDKLLSVGVTPYTTGGEGQSLHGSGPKYVSCYIDGLNPEYIVGSKINGKFMAASGRPDFDSNRWLAADVSSKWEPVLRDILGSVYKSMNVFYVVKVDNDIPPVPFKAEFLNCLTRMCPFFEKVIFRFGEKELNRSDYIGEEKEKYRNVDSTRRLIKGGSTRRVLAGLREYQERFLEESYDVKVDPFHFYLNEDQYIEIKEAHIRAECYPGNPSSAENEWMGSLRGGTTTLGNLYKAQSKPVPEKLTFKEGSGAGPGKPPKFKSYIMAPCIAMEMKDRRPELVQMYNRFSTNSVFMGDYVSSMCERMGVEYNTRQGSRSEPRPFLVLTLVITEIGDIVSDCTSENKTVSECSGNRFKQKMGGRADFNFSLSAHSRDLLKSAADNARENVPPGMKAWCKKSFPKRITDRVPINLSDTGSAEKKEKRKSPYLVFDLAGSGSSFDKTFKCDENRFLAIYNTLTKSFVSADQLDVPSSVRGVTIDNLSKSSRYLDKNVRDNISVIEDIEGLAKNSKVSIIGVSICPMQKLVESVWTNIDPKDYVRNVSCRPTRGVRAIVKSTGETIFLGDVVDIPQRKREPKPGVKPEKKKGKGKGIGDGTNWDIAHFYCTRHPDIICEYNEMTGLLMLNDDSEWVKRWYIKKTENNSRVARLLSEVYKNLFEDSKRLAKTICPIEVDAVRHIKSLEGDISDADAGGYKSNKTDWIISNFVAGKIAEDSNILSLLDKVEEIREKEAKKSEEVAA